MTFLFPPLARREVGGAALDLAGQGERGDPHLAERPTRLDPRVDVDPARARGLRPAHEAHVLQRRMGHESDVHDLRPLHTGNGVEVHAQLVGMIQILGADRMRVQIDAAQVHDPRELRRIADHDLVRRPSRGEAELDGLDPVRLRGGRAFLEEERALGAVDEPLQGHRAIRDAPERPVADRQVVADQVELRLPDRWEEDLVGVRDRHLAPGDVEVSPCGWASLTLRGTSSGSGAGSGGSRLPLVSGGGRESNPPGSSSPPQRF